MFLVLFGLKIWCIQKKNNQKAKNNELKDHLAW